MINKVVARYRDGRMVKGTVTNFSPMRDRFHVVTSPDSSEEVHLADLKALFFVRSLDGDTRYQETKSFGPRQPGRRMVCELSDGEKLTGYVMGYDPKRPGFFLIPGDSRSNNERVFVVNSAVRSVRWVDNLP